MPLIESNYFNNRPETIFITYEEVIKSPFPFILTQLQTRYKDHFKGFINFDLLKNLDEKGLVDFCIKRTEKNILRNVAIQNFDFESSIKQLRDNFKEIIWENSQELSMTKSIPILLNQKFLDKIFIYTKEYDKNIHKDIQENFKNMDKIKYITGPTLNDVLDAIPKITTYILNDIMDFSTLLCRDIRYSNILVADYGYNYTVKENKAVLRIDPDPLSKEKVYNFALFSPVKI